MRYSEAMIAAARDGERSDSTSAPYPNPAERERTALRDKWPDEFRDGARCAFLHRFDGDRERGGYPRGFHVWPLERRNAWFARFTRGYHDRLRLAREEAA